MEAMNPGLLNGASIVAVVLFLMVAFLRGWFVTRREADVYLKRAERAEALVDNLNKQNGELMEMARLGKSTFDALRKAAEQ